MGHCLQPLIQREELALASDDVALWPRKHLPTSSAVCYLVCVVGGSLVVSTVPCVPSAFAFWILLHPSAAVFRASRPFL